MCKGSGFLELESKHCLTDGHGMAWPQCCCTTPVSGKGVVRSINALAQGSFVLRTKQRRVVKLSEDGTPVDREYSAPTVCHEDIISKSFWEQHLELLA